MWSKKRRWERGECTWERWERSRTVVFTGVKTEPCALFQSGPVALEGPLASLRHSGFLRPGLIPREVQYEGDTAYSQGAPV